MERRRQAYNSLFDGPDGEIILTDLATFCRASETTFHPDARVSDLLNGRREVYLRIKEHIDNSFDKLWSMKNGTET